MQYCRARCIHEVRYNKETNIGTMKLKVTALAVRLCNTMFTIVVTISVLDSSTEVEYIHSVILDRSYTDR